MFFVLAYRFDNRFVLSLALSSLGAWFGVRLSRSACRSAARCANTRSSTGRLVAVAGAGLSPGRHQKHFLDAYLHVATNVLCVALAFGASTAAATRRSYLAGLLGLAGLSIAGGVRFKRFAFVVYGVLYGYMGLSFRVLRDVQSLTTRPGLRVRSGTHVVECWWCWRGDSAAKS